MPPMIRCFSLSLAVFTGCPADQKPTSAVSAVPGAGSDAGASGAAGSSAPMHVAATAADYAKANELGLVAVMEYHRFGPKEERWTRTPANFRKDLEFFYNNGYVTINARDLADRKINIPAGKKPLVLTFDDATDVQFRYLKGSDGKPDPTKIDPDCAIGMLDAFAQKHPDFGTAGTFFVLPSGFEQDGMIQQKFKYLDSTGREIANRDHHIEAMKSHGASWSGNMHFLHIAPRVELAVL